MDTIRRVFLFLLAVAPTNELVADEPQPTKPAAAVETHFASNGVLTAEQIGIVRELALKAGLTSIRRISTRTIPPGPGHQISATSHEEVLGREFRVASLAIHYQHENWEPNVRNTADVAHRIGDFWTEGMVHKARGGLYDYKGKQLRMLLLDEIPVAFGDPIIAAFAAGKIKFENPKDQETANEWRDGELTPVMIGEAVEKSFRLYIATKDTNASMSFICRIEDDGTLRVVAVQVRIY